MEYLDIVDENGQPTGRTVSRDTAHAEGIRHRTAHVWIVRGSKECREVLLQKRSMEKESFPGLYDTSSAGHIPAGDEPLESALRELNEELGISAAPQQLRFIGKFSIDYERGFHGRPFRDNEVTWVYLYDSPVDISALTLQASEVDGADWFGLETVWNEIQPGESARFCPPLQGVAVLREYLKTQP
ncbi:MAG: NUDIX domain-containing protein [Clostridia bacterium]|nr:NUDIX domain-containing protein [Clostridia bacterium]